MNTEEVRRRILIHGRRHFLRFGFRKTTMGGVALSAGISKKTLYLNYRNKSELYGSVMADFVNETLMGADQRTLKVTSIEKKMALFLCYVASQMTRMSPASLVDFVRCEQRAWDEEALVCQLAVEQHFRRLVSNGKRMGLIRVTFDDSLIMDMFWGTLEMISSPRDLQRSTLSVQKRMASAISVIVGGLSHMQSSKEIRKRLEHAPSDSEQGDSKTEPPPSWRHPNAHESRATNSLEKR